jgi:hypothetical protein
MKSAIEKGRVAACKGFPTSLDPKNDRNGHGTHGVSVILRIAPNARVYVGRIIDDEGTIPERNYPEVAKVLSLKHEADARLFCGR